MAASTKKLFEGIKPAEVAEKALRKAKNDREGAIKLLQKWMENDPEIHKAVMAPWFDRAARQLIGGTIRHKRGQLTRREPPNEDDTSGVRAVANTRWYGFMLPAIDKPLGDATRQELFVAADDYRQRAYNNELRAKWLDLLAKKVSHDRIVKDCLKEPQIEATWNELTAEPGSE